VDLGEGDAGIDGNRSGRLRICWEWYGCGNTDLVNRAAELSFQFRGVVKFDLKAFD
jgi:pyruvate-formate lyase-activating enzyme